MSIKVLFFICIVMFPLLKAHSQSVTPVNKKGWLFYWHDQVIWFDDDINKKVKDGKFFTAANEFDNGLVVNHLSLAKYYKSIAKGYVINTLNSDSVSKEAEYNLSDSVWVLPVQVKFISLTRPVSELLMPMGLSFKKDNNEVNIIYNFETEFNITDIEPLRERDKRRLKRVKTYEVFPPH